MDYLVFVLFLFEYGLIVFGIVLIEVNDGLFEWGSFLFILLVDGVFW